MAYTRRYLLKKIIEIQGIVLREKSRGVSQAWIYRNMIADTYHISESTFNNYLAVNAKRELEALIRSEQQQIKMNPSLF